MYDFYEIDMEPLKQKWGTVSTKNIGDYLHKEME
jgi:hypothetical protein